MVGLSSIQRENLSAQPLSNQILVSWNPLNGLDQSTSRALQFAADQTRSAFRNWTGSIKNLRRDVISEFLNLPDYLRRVGRIIESNRSIFSGQISVKDIADQLLINKPRSVFNEILSCIAVEPNGKFTTPRKFSENISFGIGMACAATDFVIKQFLISSQIISFQMIGSPFVAISAALATVSCAHSLVKTMEFRKKLDCIMQDESVSETVKAKNMLKFVYETVLFSPHEIDRIRNEILKEMPNESNEERFEAFKNKILNLSKAKIGKLNNMAGHKGATMVIGSAELLMESLNHPSKAKQAIEECKKLHEILQKGNAQRQKFYYLMLFLSFMTFVVAVVTFVSLLATISTGPIGLILLGVSIGLNIIWALAANFYIRDMLAHRINEENLNPNKIKLDAGPAVT